MSERRHWLYRPETIPKLWAWGAGVLALTVVVEVFVDLHPHFGFADWFSFNAVYGFASCLAMIVFAKWLGGFVKRPDDYYEPDPDPRGEGPIEEEIS
jgi:hypothetical protein